MEWSGNGLPESLQSVSDARSNVEHNQISESFVNESSQFYDDIESLTPSQIQAQQLEQRESEQSIMMLQKKSLDVITERQSEFSNSLKPSQRKQYSNHKQRPLVHNNSINQSLQNASVHKKSDIHSSVCSSGHKGKICPTPDFLSNIAPRQQRHRGSAVHVARDKLLSQLNTDRSFDNESYVQSSA